MKPYYSDDAVILHHGDSLDVLRTLPAASVDAVCTDPPYGLAFMGREWDAYGPAAFAEFSRLWACEAYRVLKPGGHLLAFGGTRTWHRLASGIEDAGFEIRDTITWLYGSGFPKSLDVSKAIDRQRDDRQAALRVAAWLAARRDEAGWTNRQIDQLFGFDGMAGHWTARPDMKVCHVPRWDQWQALKDALAFGDEMDAEVWRLNGRKGTPGEAWSQREVIGERTTGIGTGQGPVAYIGDSENRAVTAPATDDARRWSGWGTALKPASEPIVVARKPLAGTVAQNVLAHSTGALNIDACRVGTGGQLRWATPRGMGSPDSFADDAWTQAQGRPYAEPTASTVGRWPSNVVLSHAATPDGEDLCTVCECGALGPHPETPHCYDSGVTNCVPGCPVAELDRQSGTLTSGANPTRRGSDKFRDSYGEFGGQTECTPARGADSGGASRFFPTFRYQAKAPTAERPRGDDGTAHPTVKPLDLMRWLVRLATPPGGVVLEPFAGSGTTAEACVLEGLRCIAVERDEAYLPLITARLTKPLQPSLGLFGMAS